MSYGGDANKAFASDQKQPFGLRSTLESLRESRAAGHPKSVVVSMKCCPMHCLTGYADAPCLNRRMAYAPSSKSRPTGRDPRLGFDPHRYG